MLLKLKGGAMSSYHGECLACIIDGEVDGYIPKKDIQANGDYIDDLGIRFPKAQLDALGYITPGHTVGNYEFEPFE